MEDTMMYAERGCIYEFIEKDGSSKNKVLVVSNPNRAMDNLVSVIMLGTKGYGHDTVRINLDGEEWILHCGMVTYAGRCRLGRKLGAVSDKVMNQIDNCMAYQLGLTPVNYKAMYDELLDRVLGSNIDVGM